MNGRNSDENEPEPAYIWQKFAQSEHESPPWIGREVNSFD